jgi:hypothetical protein
LEWYFLEREGRQRRVEIWRLVGGGDVTLFRIDVSMVQMSGGSDTATFDFSSSVRWAESW